MEGKLNEPPFPSLPEGLRRRAMEHFDRLTEIYSPDKSPFSDLISKYGECLDSLVSLSKVLADELAGHFRLSRDTFIAQFREDVGLMVRNGDLRELDDREMELLSQAVADAMGAMFASLLDHASRVLADYARWATGDQDLPSKVRDLLMELLAEVAVAKAERDSCAEELEALSYLDRRCMSAET